MIYCNFLFAFLKRKNYTLYYYTINLNETEEINLKKSKSPLAFGFECSNKQNAEKYSYLNIEDLLVLKVRFIFYTIGIHKLKIVIKINMIILLIIILILWLKMMLIFQILEIIY